MSFLLGDDYASSSESESDGEESEQPMGKKADVKPITQLLPSATSVLSSVSASTASFLPPKTSTKVQSFVKSFDLIAEQETHHQEDGKEKRTRDEIQHIVETSRNDRKRSMPTQEMASGEPKREKKNAKERVKNQRVKGQAGIGSDFRGWKSETEMVLRQHFD